MYDELMGGGVRGLKLGGQGGGIGRFPPRRPMRGFRKPGMAAPDSMSAMPLRDPRQDPSGGVDDDELESILRLLVSRRIPRFQVGGIVRRPTLGMLGEDGPEAVVPLNQKRWQRPRSPGAAMAPGAGAGMAEDDPLGPQYISRFLRRRAQRTADARRRRSGVLSGLAGLDRMGQRQAMVDADISAGSDLSNLLGEADLAGAQGFVGYRRQLDRDEREAQRRRQEIEDQRRYEESQRGGFGGFLGEVAGSLIPGVAGKLFRGGSRRDPMEDYGF
jgi:hypothetical protein